jgi:putative ATP-dependent endonuclease of the OLD family
MAMVVPNSTPASTCVIRRLRIERFRGLKDFTWLPSAGVNVILGGGDAGKTTVLEAVALLFSPATSQILTDADYFGRSVPEGFCIEAVVTMPDRAGVSTTSKLSLPWEWLDDDAVSVDIDDESVGISNDPVYRVRVRGTEDLEVVYETVHPDEETISSFNVAIRRAIGLVRLSGDDRNDRDLRLVQGSALDQLLGDSKLRSKLALRLARTTVVDELSTTAAETLSKLDAVFNERALPHELSLGITSPQGMSVNALIGLTATKGEVQLPLASWGSGTRRLAALEIAALRQTENPLVVVDEVERGLEPYRQRSMVQDLQTSGSQVFLTTHSPAVLEAAGDATFWHLGPCGRIGLIAARASKHRLRHPDAYLARLAVVAEGATELGFLDSVLRRQLGVELLDVGIVLSDGGGNDDTLGILEALTASDLRFSGFADDEGRAPQRWQRVKDPLGDLLFRWPSGCIEANIIPLVADAQLEAFIRPPDWRWRSPSYPAGTPRDAREIVRSDLRSGARHPSAPNRGGDRPR